MGYTRDVLKGVGWNGGYRLISRGLAFIRIAILARILTPFQFGIVGIATLVLSFLETFTQIGFDVFFIQENKPTEKYIDTAWVLSILRGIFIFLLLYFSSGLISNFFNSIDSQLLIKLIAFVALVRGFINPSRVNMIKNINFKGETLFSSAVLFVDFSITVIVTILLRNPAGIVYGLLFGAITEVILSMILLSPRPKFRFNISHFKMITNRGKWVTLSNIFSYLFSEGDDAVVGKILNKSSLGIYQVSYKIATLPLTEITQVFNTVTFPIYVKFANERKRLIRAFRRVFLLIIIITFPLSLVVYLFPQYIIHFFLGDQWISAIPILKDLAIFGMFRALVVSFNPLFKSLKIHKYITFYSIISFAIMALSIYPLINKFGLIGTVYSVIAGTLFALVYNIHIFYKFLF